MLVHQGEDVEQNSEGHELVRLGLVLNECIDIGISSAAKLALKYKITVGLSEVFVYEVSIRKGWGYFPVNEFDGFFF